jgi:CheY-like chemotaxis protein
MLEVAGHDVTDAANGLEGYRSYRSNPSDVIITDMVMPEQDGLETIIGIRREFPNVKIIAMSGAYEATSASELRVAKAMGAQLSLEKPFARDELLAAVRKLVGHS